MKTKNMKTDTQINQEPINSDFFERLWERSWSYIKTVVDVVREPVLVLDKDFRVLVNDVEKAEAHKFLKAAAALEGVPMVRLHRLSESVKQKLKAVIGDNKTLPPKECRRLMNGMINGFRGQK